MIVYFVTPNLSSFVRNDIEILKSQFDVNVNTYNWTKKWKIPFYFIHQFFQILRARKQIDSIVISFGGYWALIPSFLGKRFGIPVFIILHGTDSCSIPSYNYGSLRSKLLLKVCRYCYKNASLLLPVSKSLLKTENLYAGNKEEADQGIEFFFPELTFNSKVIHNGLDTHFWLRDDSIAKDVNSYLTVVTQSRFYLKGGDLILDLARRNPECNFHIVGMDQLPDGASTPNNLTLHGFVSPEKLLIFYNKCQFYFQLSIFEGFGCSLVESMLCECVPIVSSSNILPAIAGDTGYVLETKNIDKLQDIIDHVSSMELSQLEQLGRNARQRAVSNFSLNRRNEQLISTIKSLKE